MKFNILNLFCLTVIIFGAPMPITRAAEDSKVLTERPSGVFVPTGFDDNDNIQIVLSGFLKNTCFHVAPHSIQVNKLFHTIYIKNHIYSENNCGIGLMQIPYQKILDLGVLPVGKYTIFVDDGKGNYEKRSAFPVSKSKDSPFSPDSMLYATVNEIQFTPGATDSDDPTLTLRGALSNSCMTLDEVRLNPTDTHVVEVLPVANVANSGNCQLSANPYEKTIKLENFPKGEVLLHVRSMGGQSVNRVITFLDRYDVRFIRK